MTKFESRWQHTFFLVIFFILSFLGPNGPKMDPLLPKRVFWAIKSQKRQKKFFQKKNFFFRKKKYAGIGIRTWSKFFNLGFRILKNSIRCIFGRRVHFWNPFRAIYYGSPVKNKTRIFQKILEPWLQLKTWLADFL